MLKWAVCGVTSLLTLIDTMTNTVSTKQKLTPFYSLVPRETCKRWAKKTLETKQYFIPGEEQEKYYNI